MANELQTKLDAILEDKNTNLLPEHLKAGVTCLGVEGEFEGSTSDAPVKLFETIEEMQADEAAEEGDLAVVYREEVQNATVDSVFQTATFPKTVVLPEAIGEDTYVNISYRAVDNSVMIDGWGSLDSSIFDMTIYTDDDSISIRYESSDGITYTRIDGGDELVDFGTEIYNSYPEEWNDAIGYFIQAGGMYFEGMYQYNTGLLDETRIGIPQLKDITLTLDGVTVTNAVFSKDTSYELSNFDKILSLLDKIDNEQFSGGYLLGIDSNNNLCAYAPYSTTTGASWGYGWGYYNSLLYNKTTSAYEGILYNGTGNTGLAIGMAKYTLNPNAQTYIRTNISKATISGTTRIYFPEKLNSVLITYSTLNNISDASHINVQVYSGTTFYNTGLGMNIAGYDDSKGYLYYYYNRYLPAPTQLNLTEENQLLPGKKALGKNGVVVGDGSIYDNLDQTLVLQNILGLQKFTPIPSSSLELYGESDTEYAASDAVVGKLSYFKRNVGRNQLSW